MRLVLRTAALAGLVLLTGCGHAENPRQEPSSPSDGDMSSATLCAPEEHTVFSCRIADREVLASLCTSPDVGADSGYMYYAYGATGRLELTYPMQKAPPAPNFARTHLAFAGGTGGYAYSFTIAGTKHILYSISGAAGTEEQGVLTLEETGRLQAALRCAPDSLVENDAEVLRPLMHFLAPDESIELHGLPLDD